MRTCPNQTRPHASRLQRSRVRDGSPSSSYSPAWRSTHPVPHTASCYGADQRRQINGRDRVQNDAGSSCCGSATSRSQTVFALARTCTLRDRSDLSHVATALIALSAAPRPGKFSTAALGLTLQPDGRIVAAGNGRQHPPEPALAARYTAAGELDSSFGNGGKVLAPSSTTAEAVALQSTAASCRRDGPRTCSKLR